MNKIVNVKEKKAFFRKMFLLKFLSLLRIKIIINYKDKLYSDSKGKHPKEIEEIVKVLDILNTKKRKEKYSLIYDYACDYLDNEFNCHNWCDFKNNMCVCNRAKAKEYQISSCCTRWSTKETCKYFDDSKKRCGIRCLSCKIFVCFYLAKRKIKYRVNDVIYLKYFLSIRQKIIAGYSYFHTKEEIINKWLKFYKLP